MKINEVLIETGLKMYLEKDPSIYGLISEKDDFHIIAFYYRNVFQNEYKKDSITEAKVKLEVLINNAHKQYLVDENESTVMNFTDFLNENENYVGDIEITLPDFINVAEIDGEVDGDMIKSTSSINYVYTDDIKIIGYKKQETAIGFFNAQKYGRINLSYNPMEINNGDFVDNSFFFYGGFLIDARYRKKGIGKQIIKMIFEKIPQLENIVLFAEMNVGYLFWKKIGGEKILTLKEEEYELLQKDLINHMKVFSGDLVLMILRREKFFNNE